MFAIVVACVAVALGIGGPILGIHRVHEGCVGVYWKGGALLDTISRPGYHAMFPGVTKTANLQVSLKTSTVQNIPCGTSSGIVVHFAKIEVVHQLHVDQVLDTMRNYSLGYEKLWIHDRVHHEMNQICSKNTLHEVYISKFNELDEELQSRLSVILASYAPGIRIISIRLTKPKIPERIRRNYELVDEQKTKYLIAMQKQKTVMKTGETEKASAVMLANKQLAVAMIDFEKRIQNQKSAVEIAQLEDEMRSNRSREETNAWYYRSVKETEGMKARLTPEFLNYMRLLSSSHNMVVHYGNRIPSGLISLALNDTA